ncbi:radical SAM/SPASM domain-containing protein [Abyssisolibacter fermentans]|uniref:radical SAM/SPASM domain-containing protein n=1 Tax=Abyssisolibacter fermentans TaxID=1766203 RepID=UPI00083661B8|nr:radical SAM protein [Abyssisolibacter fermentans]
MKIVKDKNTDEIKYNSHVLLFNTYMGSWVKLSQHAYEMASSILNKNQDEAITTLKQDYNISDETANSFLQFLLKNYFISKETENIKKIHGTKTDAIRVKMCYFHITENCNFKCSYCSYDANSTSKKEYSTNQYKSLIRKLQLDGIEELVLSGGEPLLRKDLEELLKFSEGRFKSIGLVTNGSLIDEKKAELLTKYVNKIQISIDSGIEKINDATRGKGSFKRAIKGLKKLKSAGHKNILISPTITKISLENIESIVELANEFDVYLELNFFTPYGRGIENYDKLKINNEDKVEALIRSWKKADELNYTRYNINTYYKKKSKISLSCGICKDQITVDANGDIYPCPLLMSDKFKIGNLFNEKSLNKVIEKSVISKQILTRNVNSIDECSACEVRYFCKGGCMAYDYQQSGNLFEKGGDCSAIKNLYEELILNTDSKRDLSLKLKDISSRVMR